MSYITDITGSEMIEATRLTREGRLAEATALLQRLLRRSKAAPNTADYASCDTAGAPYVASSHLLAGDAMDRRGEREADPAASPQACRQGPSARFAGWPAGTVQKPKRRALHGLFGELKQGLDGVSPAHRRLSNRSQLRPPFRAQSRPLLGLIELRGMAFAGVGRLWVSGLPERPSRSLA